MNNNRFMIYAVAFLLFAAVGNTLSCGRGTSTNYTELDKRRLELVRDYAERVLLQGQDQWSGQNTPLLVDGINVDTGEPVVWRYNDEEFIISNLASQQNLFRMLTGLSNLTGDNRYKEAAKSSIQYHFDNLADESGLLRWGGHQFIDLKTLEPVGHFDANLHEFKNSFPFYELMWEADQEATTRFLRAYWNAHVYDWKTLDMNRHGRWNQELGDLWDHEFGYPDPFFEGDGLTFINAGSDLIHGAGMLYRLNGEQEALDWAKRLHGMYVKARHPDTGLGVYQYSMPRQRNIPPADGSLERHTGSGYGDRARNQFGSQFGDIAREGWVMWGSRVKSIYVTSGFMQLGLAEAIGEDGSVFLEGVASGLRALTEHVYDPHENHFVPMWADGTRLTGESVQRIGYYCREGCDQDQVWEPLEVDVEFLMTYARAYRLTEDVVFWETARNMARGLGLGDIGSRPGQDVALNMNASGSGYEEIFALLELHRSAAHPEYLDRARIVADRMIAEHYHNGFFLPSANHVNAKFDALEPLALLTLDAVLRGEPESVPAHVGGRGYIHGRYDGFGQTYDYVAIWGQQR